jgi:hypothetical protein
MADPKNGLHFSRPTSIHGPAAVGGTWAPPGLSGADLARAAIASGGSRVPSRALRGPRGGTRGAARGRGHARGTLAAGAAPARPPSRRLVRSARCRRVRPGLGCRCPRGVSRAVLEAWAGSSSRRSRCGARGVGVGCLDGVGAFRFRGAWVELDGIGAGPV